jgi:hypothetical protein
MHTSAFMIGKSDDDTIAVMALPAPPFDAAKMADAFAKADDGVRVQSVEVMGWTVRIVGKDVSALFLFIDAEEPISGETLSETMAWALEGRAEAMHSTERGRLSTRAAPPRRRNH